MNAAHLEHPALLYASTEDVLEYMVPYVTAGLDDDEVVFVAARGDNLAALRSEIGPRGGAAGWADAEEWHPHTGTRLRAFHELVTDQLAAGATSIRLAGWPTPGSAIPWPAFASPPGSPARDAVVVGPAARRPAPGRAGQGGHHRPAPRAPGLTLRDSASNAQRFEPGHREPLRSPFR